MGCYDWHPMAGYPLKLSGVACVGVLACGPSPDEPTGGGGSGYELTGTADQGTATITDGQTSAATAGGTNSSADGGTEQAPECQFRGDICGEMSVCQCDCDFYDFLCCSCAAAECTEDAHCDEGSTCVNASATYTYVSLVCVPAQCNQSTLSFLWVSSMEEATAYEGLTCMGSLQIRQSDLVDATAFSSLEYLHTELAVLSNAQLTTLEGLQTLAHASTLVVDDNATLTSIDALSGLTTLTGGSIRNNPMLPTADVEALLAGIDGGDAIEVCGNLDGDPCP